MIVGLGNPGKDYARTRHNVGFMAIDRLAEQYGISVSKKECRALTGKGIIAGTQVLLVKPQTYMNDSGSAVGQLIHIMTRSTIYHHSMMTWISRLVRSVSSRRAAPVGTTVIKSVIAHLNSQVFDRLKVGIGHDDHNNVIGHVLSGFHKDEVPVIDDVLSHVDEWLSFWLKEGIVATMNKYN